jgi:hypothetical protein
MKFILIPVNFLIDDPCLPMYELPRKISISLDFDGMCGVSSNVENLLILLP